MSCQATWVPVPSFHWLVMWCREYHKVSKPQCVLCEMGIITPHRAVGGLERNTLQTAKAVLSKHMWSGLSILQPPLSSSCHVPASHTECSRILVGASNCMWPLWNSDGNLILPHPFPSLPPLTCQVKNHCISRREVTQGSKLSKWTQSKQEKKKARNHQAFLLAFSKHLWDKWMKDAHTLHRTSG